jgi:hypothetical protein
LSASYPEFQAETVLVYRIRMNLPHCQNMEVFSRGKMLGITIVPEHQEQAVNEEWQTVGEMASPPFLECVVHFSTAGSKDLLLR